MKISVNTFSGTQPKLAPHLLKPSQAVLAENARVERSDVRSWRDSEVKLAIDDAAWKALFQWTATGVDTTIGTQWLYSVNDVDYVENPLANDSFERLFFTGEAELRAYSNDLPDSAIAWDQAAHYHKVGHAKPTSGWGFVSGDDGGTEFRSYVYTYVNRYGQESGPSPVLNTDVYDGSDDVIIEDFAQPAAGFGLRTTTDSGANIPVVRIYRTNASALGAEYQYVGEFNAATHTFGTSTFTDNVADADLGEVLSTELGEGTPTGLTGLIGLSNGIFAGFIGNELYLSEPYKPHMWPDEYVLSFDYNIVGLGQLGTNIVVLTEGVPYIVSGYAPEAMQQQRLNGFYPCVAKRSIVSSPFGVIYTSYEGLIMIDHNGPRNITFEWLTPTDWQENYYPTYMHGEVFNGMYFGFFDDDTNSGTFILDLQNNLFTSLRQPYMASHLKVAEGKLYLIQEERTAVGSVTTDSIREWEGDPYNRLYYRWKSRRHLLPADVSFTCAQVMVDVDFYDDLVDDISDNDILEGLNAIVWATEDLQDPFNYGDGIQDDLSEIENPNYYFNAQHFNFSAMQDLSSLQINQYVKFRLYVDNVLVFERNVSDDKYFRLPAVRGRRVEFEVAGYVPVRRVTVAQSPQELMEG
jgi:hypothetical protein